ncbi:MAG: Fumarate reductase flavoprotein subunit [Smithella sp. PtaU1.Bin162]|nr:MAG: Fumarate reductase flavoprotein subunit [Smithella sp. PtaU1.Bin162]
MSKEKKGLTRRGFLKGAVVGAGCLALSEVGFKEAIAAPRLKWNRETDVLIVGGGMSGLTAAIVAYDTKAKVLVVEKEPVMGGCLNIYGGILSGAGTRIQKAQGIVDSPEAHFLDCMRGGDFKNYAPLLKLECDNAGPTIDWLQDMGVTFRDNKAWVYPEWRGVARSYYSQPRTISRDVITREIRKREIPVITKTRVVKIYKDAKSKRVIGVEAKGEKGDNVNIRAKVVVLTTGGFANNFEMIEKYCRERKTRITVAAPWATGDGIMLGTDVGAGLTHMKYLRSYAWGLDLKSNRRGITAGSEARFQGAIQVDKKGRRFVNEMGSKADTEDGARKLPNMTFYLVVDSVIIEKCINSPYGFIGGWDRNRVFKEAERGEFIKKADTVRGVAEKAGIDPAGLEATIIRYNKFVAEKKDPDFGRKELQEKIEKPPFYVLELTPIAMYGHGGLTVKVDGRDSLKVVNKEGEVIPGLYAAGEIVGGFNGANASSGMGATPCFVFGRIAGKNAALEALEM